MDIRPFDEECKDIAEGYRRILLDMYLDMYEECKAITSGDQQMNLKPFVEESWDIEGLSPDKGDVLLLCSIHLTFLIKESFDITDVETLASLFTGGRGVLRKDPDMDVYVGNHYPPLGGPHIVKVLSNLCEDARMISPYELHQRFEHLHPFMDGNGRVGRLLWLWAMFNRYDGYKPTTFLRPWYYQSLENFQLH